MDSPSYTTNDVDDRQHDAFLDDESAERSDAPLVRSCPHLLPLIPSARMLLHAAVLLDSEQCGGTPSEPPPPPPPPTGLQVSVFEWVLESDETKTLRVPLQCPS